MQNNIELLEQVLQLVQETKNNTRGYDHDEKFEALSRKLNAMLMIEEIKSKMDQKQATV